MNVLGWILFIVVIIGVFLAFKFIKKVIKVLLLVGISIVVLYFTAKYTGLSIW